ncbi:CBO0543 family protein [Paenibacillus tarimensis]|uniref:CBO0543 family protein n=1 Tax=Paenibacillus tarimensis TaxID=416012 RepID=UPI001F3A880E|nr:CBO0543 family protein [Paenibacillus tarimensis]MCF2945075.1 hypothetical protein [Paenibacillus tarimensis]
MTWISEWQFDHWFLASVYAVCFILLFLIPKDRRRQAHAVFLFQGFMTWILGLFVVEMGWLDYPVREFNRGTQTSFLFEYLAYPTVTAYFNVYFPAGRPVIRRLLYTGAYCTAITVPEIFLEKYTGLIEYHTWTWYWTFISLYLTLMLSRWFHNWFFYGGGNEDPVYKGLIGSERAEQHKPGR